MSTASIAGLRTGAGPHVYNACKAAVIHLTRSVAVELAPAGIRVNCVCPGFIATRIIGAALGLDEERTEASLEALPGVFQDAQPLKRAGMPEDIANAVLWLASDEARFVTGHALVVDGGSTLQESAFGGTPEEAMARFAPILGGGSGR